MQFDRLKRREFITLLGGASLAWPLAAPAQQPAMPVIGFLHSASPEPNADRVRAFRQALKDTGYVEGENMAILYRWAEGRYDRLPELAAELVRRQVAVIAASDTGSATAAKAATTTIPIVFGVGEDPVRLGLVASLSRPGGNATGVNFFVTELGSKQLGLLHELIPAAARVGLLVNPNYPTVKRTMRDVTAAASAIGLQVDVVQASDSREIEVLCSGRLFAIEPMRCWSALMRSLSAGASSLPYWRRDMPFQQSITCVSMRKAGGMMSYGTNVRDAWRQVGAYTGRILKGAKPADLPVVQSTKFELVINLPTARALGIEVPPTLLARADEVIE